MNEHVAHNSFNENVTNIDSPKNIESRKRKATTMNENNHSKLIRANYYSILDLEKDTQRDDNVIKDFEKHVKEFKESEQHNKATNVNQNKPKIIENVTNIQNNNNVQTKIPPINIIDIETKKLIQFIKNGLMINEFKIKQFRDKKSLFMNNLKDYMKVKAYLEKVNAKFFTFTPKGQKTKTYLLKGLNADTNVDEVLNALNVHQNEDLQFLKVSRFSTKLSVKNGYILPIFLVQISADSKVNKLKQIRTLLHHVIQWDQIKNQEISQCRNCQGFFHSAANCYLKSQCVKCGKDHEKAKCSLMKYHLPKEINYTAFSAKSTAIRHPIKVAKFTGNFRKKLNREKKKLLLIKLMSIVLM